MKIEKRNLNSEERSRILRERPPFGEGRKAARADLERDEAEMLSFRIRRAWDVNECRPPCCPRVLLIETDEREFIYLESWSVLPATDVQRRCIAERAIASHRLLHFRSEGETVELEQTSVREWFFDFSAAQCEVVNAADLPDAFTKAEARS